MYLCVCSDSNATVLLHLLMSIGRSDMSNSFAWSEDLWKPLKGLTFVGVKDVALFDVGEDVSMGMNSGATSVEVTVCHWSFSRHNIQRTTLLLGHEPILWAHSGSPKLESYLSCQTLALK